MVISFQEVEYIAELARLELTEEEKQIFTQQLDKILEYAQMVSSLNLENIEPTSHAIPMKTSFREDKAISWERPQDIVKAGPETEENFFVVPKILA